MIKVPITNLFTVAHDLWWKNFTCETGLLSGYLGGQTGVWQVWYVAAFLKALGANICCV